MKVTAIMAFWGALVFGLVCLGFGELALRLGVVSVRPRLGRLPSRDHERDHDERHDDDREDDPRDHVAERTAERPAPG